MSESPETHATLVDKNSEPWFEGKELLATISNLVKAWRALKQQVTAERTSPYTQESESDAEIAKKWEPLQKATSRMDIAVEETLVYLGALEDPESDLREIIAKLTLHGNVLNTAGAGYLRTLEAWMTVTPHDENFLTLHSDFSNCLSTYQTQFSDYLTHDGRPITPIQFAAPSS
ncbi:hypothetical protein TREMEDRAFT_59926 [Tremella mesenterica DSM 1558]|uniref:uncharacterized protein n=1 Tax=Tremella mesenterica (strain ATCC 24925 / CBS 8224 / DSM 1558 / NBRC 9311 / NRRL Y-6157 / RJB 2259-6 / UBC 559-6) TaxID=578456 RepID=UPI0003F495CA|nr:uncharacterized protein TREMEDRAFT_59926 [Tremella mesenterica DSM 1558]EIW70988.1 hypothetical protein TREMEDRAFT_59926 [Tremella mesenterica DSM 1558]